MRAMFPEWTTAKKDWKKCIIAGESIMPCAPLYPDVARIAEETFKELIVADVIGKPRMGDITREWVYEFVRAIFGAYDPDTKNRLIKEFFLLISKKNTKSTIAAGIMLTIAILNERHSAEFIILAPTKEVADNSFVPMRDFILNDEELSERFSISEHTKTITDLVNNSKIKVIAADSNSAAGKKATVILVDEVWLFGKKSGAESMFREAKGGLASRPEGCVIYLSTMSDDVPCGVFKNLLGYARDVRDGIIEDKEFLPMLYEFPEEVIESGGHLDPKNFYITNPNLGASVSPTYLEAELRKASQSQTTLADFLAKHLNVEIGMALRANRWAGSEFWLENIDKSVTFDSIIELSDVIVVGGDGGGMDDLLGLCVLGRDKEDSKIWRAWFHAWCHKNVLIRRKSEEPKLRQFEADGHLTIYDEVGDDVSSIAGYVSRIEESGLLYRVGIDPMMVGALQDGLIDGGVPEDKIFGVQQGGQLMGYIQTTERKLGEKRLLHDGSPMMTWCVANCRCVMIGNGMRVTKQASGTGKIDPVIALYNACAIMSTNPAAQSGKYGMYFF